MGNCVTAKGPKKDPKRLTDEEIKLLLDNTRLTRPQIIALHQNFLKECPTGKLTKKDFIKLFKEVHPSENKKEKADKFCEYVFKVIDQQNLGYITFQEFVLCFSLTSDGEFKDKCEFAFKLYDLDKDGKISKKEMTQVLEALYDLSGITDRKGDKSPAKKVEDIIKAINAKSALQAIEGPSPIVVSSQAASNDGKVSIQVTSSKPAETSQANTSTVLSTPSATIDAGGYGKLSAPVLTVSTTSATEDKKKAEKDAKKEKKAEKPKKEDKPKVKETKEEKAAKKEKDKQEKERLKQEKEKEKKEKAERAKQEKEQKEREKKEKAELKKLDKSIKADKSASKSDKPAKEAKQPKAIKASKPEKIEYITKDQFIEACSTDEGLRQLFVDSIFCANPDATISATLGETIVAKASEAISAAADSVNAGINSKLPSIKTSKFVSLSTTTTTITTNNNNNETTTTTEKVESKTEELPSAELKSDEPTKQTTSIEEIIDDLKNQININVNNEKVELNASS